MKVALLGFELVSSNKGCEALSYSFINMLNELNISDLQIHVFGNGELGSFPKQYPMIQFYEYRTRMKRPNYWIYLKKQFDSMDCIFDITFGDGFSDIYGKFWNAYTNMAKQIAIWSKAPIVFLPQTYGPYYNSILKKWAVSLVKNADAVYARDERSCIEMNGLLDEQKVLETTDIAFALPYDVSKYKFNKENIRIGINISSLLWDGGHAKGIKLTTDYQSYCKQLIEYCLGENYKVHLIAHVVDKVNYHALENDVRVCKELNEIYPETILAPEFDTPIDAKSYISGMDVFVGARMHSTIGALSSHVATIPFSYSKKFEGLFDNLMYPFVVSATKITTEEALQQTKKYINERDELRNCQQNVMETVNNKLNLIRQMLKQRLSEEK